MNTFTVPRPVKGNEIPKNWKVDIPARQLFRIIIQPIIKEPDLPMPSEELIRTEFVKEVMESEEDYKKGDFVRCNSKEESDALFKRIWNE
jgi:antitoxin component of RelBE/YafQ-DinJ toxin-antitoxin module